MKTFGKYLLCQILFLFVALVLRTPVPVQAANGDRIAFTDESGSYLEKKKADWYARDKEGRPLTGLTYLQIKKGNGLESGYYYFDQKGKLEARQGICRFANQKVNGRVFHGYYYHTSSGRFCTNALGIRYFQDGLVSDSGRVYQGYYYIGPYGKVTASSQVRYLKKTASGGRRFAAGYYYFCNGGRLSTGNAVRKLSNRANGKTFKGYYHFGEVNGRLSTTTGWKQIGGVWYYFGTGGKAYQNRWAGEYYLGADGKMLTSCRTPDGKYVGYDGKKCAKEEVALGALKDQLIRECSQAGGSWSVYVKNLDTNDYLVTNEKTFYSASVIKPFVMASVYDCIKRGQIQNSSSLQANLRAMITVSDNEAYNELVRRQGVPYGFSSGAAVVNQYLQKNGYTGTTCRHTLHPSGSGYVGIGGSNTVSARDCGVLLERIYRGTCVSKDASAQMLSLLLQQQRKWKIPAGLPAGTKVANKTGETSSTQHDMAIIWSPGCTYVLTVHSSGVSEYRAVQMIKKISAEVYAYLQTA